jgi:hypothetical protein
MERRPRSATFAWTTTSWKSLSKDQGRDTRAAWSDVIDVAAVLMRLVSMSGLAVASADLLPAQEGAFRG